MYLKVVSLAQYFRSVRALNAVVDGRYQTRLKLKNDKIDIVFSGRGMPFRCHSIITIPRDQDARSSRDELTF